MDSVAVVEGEKKRILASLDEIFGELSLPDLPEVAETIEAILHIECKEVIEKHSDVVCGCVKQNTYLIRDNREYYGLAIGPDIRNPSLLIISLNPCSPGLPKETQRKTSAVEGFGRFMKIRIVMPQNLQVDWELLSGLIGCIVETIYGWMRQRIEELAEREEIALVEDLYGYFKRIFPSDELRKTLWFASITEGYGFRLISRDVARESFSLIDRHAGIYGYSTTRLVADLLSTKLPARGLLMQIALEKRQCIEGDLSQARYKQEGSIYAATMAALYGSEAFTIFPVRIDDAGQLSVFALFPTHVKSVIEPILAEHKVELSRMVENASSRIRKALRIFEGTTKAKPWREWAEPLMLQPNFFGLGVDLKKNSSMAKKKAGKQFARHLRSSGLSRFFAASGAVP